MGWHYLVRWRFLDGPEEARTGEATYDDYRRAEQQVARIVESPRPLEWVTGPTRYLP